MDAKKYITENGRDRARQVAESAGTTIEYFIQLAAGHRRPSVKLAQKLVVASGNQLEFVALLTTSKPGRSEQ